MSIVRTFYKKFCGDYFDDQILSAKAFLAKAAIQVLFHRYREVTLTTKYFPKEHKKEQTIPAKPIRLRYSDPECMIQSVGMPFSFNQNTENSRRTSCSGKISAATANQVQNTFIYFGSTNPAGQRVLRPFLESEGEMTKSAYPAVRLFQGETEKLMANKNFFLLRPYVDRLDYTSCGGNCYSLTVKKLANTNITPRVSTQLLHSCGRFSPRFELCNIVSGDRLLSGNICPNKTDIPIGHIGDIYQLCVKYPERLDELGWIGTLNRIFLARGVALSPTDIWWDLCKFQPYKAYEKFEYNIPMVIIGDSYDKYLLRIDEMRQQSHIIDHYFIKITTRGIQQDDHKIYSPKRFEMVPSREDLIHHFKYSNSLCLITPGQLLRPKGEFGVYLISKRTTHPYRRKILAPGSPQKTILESLSPNLFLRDTLGFLDLMEIDL